MLFSSTLHEPSGEDQDAGGCFGTPPPPVAGGASETAAAPRPGPLLVFGRHLRVVQSGFGSVDDWRKSLELFACRVLGVQPGRRLPAPEVELDRRSQPLPGRLAQPFAVGLTPRQRYAPRGDSGVPPLHSLPPPARFMQP